MTYEMTRSIKTFLIGMINIFMGPILIVHNQEIMGWSCCLIATICYFKLLKIYRSWATVTGAAKIIEKYNCSEECKCHCHKYPPYQHPILGEMISCLLCTNPHGNPKECQVIKVRRQNEI